jgi:hypothetical protein
LINLFGPFIRAYYKKDFEALLEWAVKQQCEMLKAQVENAAEKGVNVEITLDPTSVPMGLHVWHVSEEYELEEAPKPQFSIVEDDEDAT